jgi:hypothetical protein
MTIVDFPSQGSIGASLKPKRFDLEIYQGDTFDVDLSFNQPGGAPVDLTAINLAVGFVKGDGTDAEVPIVATHNDTGGVVNLLIEDTSALSGSYKWDLQLVSGTKKRTYIGGVVTVTEDITP